MKDLLFSSIEMHLYLKWNSKDWAVYSYIVQNIFSLSTVYWNLEKQYIAQRHNSVHKEKKDQELSRSPFWLSE